MEFDVSVGATGDYLLVRLFKSPTLQLRDRYMQAGIELGRQTGISRFLIDARNAPSATSVFDDYQSAYDSTVRFGLQSGVRIAGLITATDASRRFIETAANNAGFQVRLFTDEEQAVAWLCAAPGGEKTSRR